MKRSLAILLTALFLILLTRIPYDALRRERIRAFGEVSTAAIVQGLATDDQDNHKRFLVTYRYQGPDGKMRQREAPYPAPIWNTLKVGQRIIIYYSVAEPNLSRGHDEVEDEFITWLRTAVRGDSLPEFSSQP